jgi:hypothetical protein
MKIIFMIKSFIDKMEAVQIGFVEGSSNLEASRFHLIRPLATTGGAFPFARMGG